MTSWFSKIYLFLHHYLIANGESVRSRRFREVLNYVGQLRLYSYADLLLMLCWLGADRHRLIGCSLLWFGFLIYLETIHKDRGRARWHWSIWVTLWISGIVLEAHWTALIFIIAAAMYTLKKHAAVGWMSPVINGLVKTTLVLGLPHSSGRNLMIIFAAMTFRNLMGDVRDAGKDYEEHMKTIPINFGYTHNTALVYPMTLALTSVLWTWLGDGSVLALMVVWIVQGITYRLTPR